MFQYFTRMGSFLHYCLFSDFSDSLQASEEKLCYTTEDVQIFDLLHHSDLTENV